MDTSLDSASDKTRKEIIDSEALISIGMPAFNCQNTIAVAIRSILAQTYPKWELLVIDDGSTDATVEIAESFHDDRIRVFRDGKHKGIPSRANEAIMKSSGEFFARMDGDDVAYPERLAVELAFLNDHPDVDLVGASMLVFADGGEPRGKRQASPTHEEICEAPIKGFGIAQPTWLGKRSWFKEHLYDETMVLAEDQELLLRTHETSRFANVPQVLLGYRENALRTARNLTSRKLLLRRYIRWFVRKGKWIAVAQAICVHSTKAAIYAFCSLPWLRTWLLQYRARFPLTNDELNKWSEVQVVVGTLPL